MAKRTINRRELREQAEAAEKRGVTISPDDADTGEKSGKTKEKKKAVAKPKRVKAKVIIRKRLIWGVFSGTMKEEGRFAYGEREAADARAADLTAKHKKTYFVQPIKEPLGDKVIDAEEEAEVEVEAEAEAEVDVDADVDADADE
ncbi:MAG: hypothetical protein NT069_15985 [Planctomycetota bacterium]|nr:hypothetical protein [Planctomycetota bacterium]